MPERLDRFERELAELLWKPPAYTLLESIPDHLQFALSSFQNRRPRWARITGIAGVPYVEFLAVGCNALWRDQQWDAERTETESGGKKPRKRRRSDVRPLTAKQAEAVQIVGECQGDFSKAARRLGKDRKTVKQHYEAGLAKLGEGGVPYRKPKTTPLPTGLRGDDEVTVEDDSRARIRPTDRRRGG